MLTVNIVFVNKSVLILCGFVYDLWSSISMAVNYFSEGFLTT